MKKLLKTLFLVLALPLVWTLDFDPAKPLAPAFVGPAQAIIGRPLTPVSYAGVARRTTRRAVAYSSAATAEAAAQTQQPVATAPASTLPQDTVVSALPSGCTSTVVDGVSLFNCGGVMYQPSFQGNNLVYVVK